MADPVKRESILDDIETQLNTISQANGYRLDVARVTRQWIPPGDIKPDEFPCLEILDDVEPPFYHGQRVVYEFTVLIYGFIKRTKKQQTDSSENLSQRLNKLLRDVKDVLLVDPRRNGVAMNTTFGTSDTSYAEEDGVFELPVKVKYREFEEAR